jgi:hypothetical protein
MNEMLMPDEGFQKLCDEFLTPDSMVVEIGAYKGGNSVFLSANCLVLACIDEWRDYEDNGVSYKEMVESEAYFDVQVAHLDNVHKFRTSSRVAASMFGNRIVDLVYIDTRTTYASIKEDVENWWPKVKFGGTISGSHYNLPEVKKAIDEIFEKADRVYSDNSWAIMKFPGRWQENEK